MAKLSPEAERRIEEYLGQVRAALEGWSERDRDEICENLRQHVEDALPDAPVVEEQVDEVLAALGSPEGFAERRGLPPSGLPGWAALLAEPFVLIGAVGVFLLLACFLFVDWRLAVLLLLPCCLGFLLWGGAGRRIIGAVSDPGLRFRGRLVAVTAGLVTMCLGVSGTVTLMWVDMYAGPAAGPLGRLILVSYSSLGCFTVLGFWIASGCPILVRRSSRSREGKGG